MSYSFTPLSDDQLDAIDLVPEGIYNFEVVKSTHKTSKSNNAMAEIKINVWDEEGRIHQIFDYLVFSQVPLNIRKVKHFCDSVSLQQEYKQGSLREELEGLSGKVNIGIKEPQSNPNGGTYPKKNYVIDYVVQDKGHVKSVKTIIEPTLNDDLPF